MAQDPNTQKKSSVKGLIIPVVFLVIWLAIIFAAVLRQFQNVGGPDLVAIAVIIGIGGTGVYIVGRSVVRRFLRMEQNK